MNAPLTQEKLDMALWPTPTGTELSCKGWVQEAGNYGALGQAHIGRNVFQHGQCLDAPPPKDFGKILFGFLRWLFGRRFGW